ncbi:MAG TPA: SagB/ThcOx family dehydrogenase [Anaerolineae bacterium]|nr:SagB/ThcOx family dehydrogenase [Anaerolineae bacterium]HQI82951.1 SagB/ThcOx family dehydrogenase [Anaerolineae bacterium]
MKATEPTIETYRKFLKSDQWDRFGEMQTDQQKRLPAPPLQKPYPVDAPLSDLVSPADLTVGTLPLRDAINRRQSHRRFNDAALTLEELSFLLWATQGVHEIWRGGIAARRTVPSAGARHPFETYLLINRVDGITPGLYRYLSLDHKLCFLRADPALPGEVSAACNEQSFIGTGAVVFMWTVIPYRTEWRYSFISPKIIALDAGHVCQNLYLACEAIGAGTCAIGAYNQAALDALLGVDGIEEFAIYVAPVGKV